MWWVRWEWSMWEGAVGRWGGKGVRCSFVEKEPCVHVTHLEDAAHTRLPQLRVSLYLPQDPAFERLSYVFDLIQIDQPSDDHRQ